MSKKDLSERDICAKHIAPAIKSAGWDTFSQMREEVYFTDGRIQVQGRTAGRLPGKRADIILYKNDIPLAVIEAKDGSHSVSSGMQQALDYADILDIPFAAPAAGLKTIHTGPPYSA